MIKGIYNENEFYTNHYWATKYFDELKSKIQNVPNLKEKIEQLKSISTVYWDLADTKDISSSDKNELFESFYQKLFEILGHAWVPTKRQTLDGRYYSSVSETKKDSKSHVLVALTNQKETGSFENIPYQLSKLDFDEQEEADDRELTEIVSEELESETGPKWYILGSLDGLFLIERTKWAYGRFIRIDFTEVFSQKDEDVYSSIIGLFSKDVLAPDSGISIHSELDDNSHRYAFAVTTELREGVREAIELLINEMIYAKREAKQEFLKKGKESTEYAKELSHDALFYVYRLIFLLFLESQGEDSELLPLKSEIYRHGYMLEKLLEVTFRKIHEGTQEYEGTFIQESLERIFDLIYNGFTPQKSADLIAKDLSTTGFLVKGLKSDLFDPEKVKHLKGVTLRNGVLQKILQKLSMADMKEGKKTRKARVSYANLGINQLGAVYEGLLSYTGFFAQEDLYELTQVKKGKDDDEDSDYSEQDEIDDPKVKVQKIDLDKVYLAPKSLVEKYKKDKKYKLTEKHFVLDPETGEPVVYKKGSFMFRMAGRDRQKLASFYTPESLTKLTVKYSLKVLFESKKTLSQLKSIKILEPAMGSGAFLNEAVNQLADKILETELKENPTKHKSPKDRQARLWNIKYDLIANNLYGVDLNPTAIELARFSLWLNCIGAGKEPPKFESNLKIGNSLIGARFKKNAEGKYPWLMLDQGMVDFGKKLAEYDKSTAAKFKVFREDLLKSELKSSDLTIEKVQVLAEGLYGELLSGKGTRSAYEKLKICSDIWCAYFFLNACDLVTFPNKHQEIISVFHEILENGSSGLSKELQLGIDRIVQKERFFHWELEFPEEIFTGGFDLILGNPPWVAVEWQDALYVSDSNVIPLVHKMNATDTKRYVEELQDREIFRLLEEEYIRLEGYSRLLDIDFYRALRGVSKNTYKAFNVLGFELLKHDGALGLIQEDGILEDKASFELRKQVYAKLKYHFQFQNEKFLFAEVGHAKRFSVNIFLNQSQSSVSFQHIGNLFLPITVDLCFDENCAGEIPLIKYPNGKWNIDGHPQRVITIDHGSLALFAEFMSTDNFDSPPFLNIHAQPLLEAIRKISKSHLTIRSHLGAETIVGSWMFDETKAQKSGYTKLNPARPRHINRVILSGPHIAANNPFSKETAAIYRSKFSYNEVDLESIDDDFIPRTTYSLEADAQTVDNIFPKLNNVFYRDHFRIISRSMINPTNERCLFACIIPPGVGHIHSMTSITTTKLDFIPTWCGFCGSIICDAILRLNNKTNLYYDDLADFPLGNDNRFFDSIGRRALALNGLTSNYSDLWKSCGGLQKIDSILNGRPLIGFGQEYKREFGIRSKLDRLNAAAEIDVLVGLSYGLSADEIIQIYKILFPVLVMIDQKSSFNRSAVISAAYDHFKSRGY
jgi:hypothetical protein